ncbi:hypothetical protein [Bradyrhizobium sp. WD16]|uniref:hypothetical protein n=1 Tax=Bradyrhizobium sp. WD16 TaxID=1521768 RepID=UPI0020A3B72C|nr:hypothetical protein [Bradyrhizobium sp. WD16]UTD29887.1 hypothetical protein DB459_26235 [Bradyrhizobium sp. WD16]
MALAAQSLERLRDFLAQLPPKSQALLMREFERAVERGQDVAVASLVLEQLRLVVRATDSNERQRSEDPARLVFRPLEPFLVDTKAALRPGQIRRVSLNQIWNWLKGEAIVGEVAELDAALRSGPAATVEQATRKVQLAAANAIEQVASTGRGADQRALSRVGGPAVVEDLAATAVVLKNREPLESFSARIAGNVRNLAESQLAAVQAAMNVPSLQTAEALPFSLSLLIQKLASPWQVIRLAVAVAGSDDEIRVAATNYGVAVAMVIHDLSELVSELRTDMKQGRLESLSHRLKIIHDGLRGLRTELDIRNESAWGKRLSAIRAEISNILRAELEGVPGRVRRLLRQRPDKDITAASRLDPTEIEETAALIDFVAVCRTYASELAINEVTLRTFSDLQQYTEAATQALVESLRASDPKTRPFRQMQVDAAIRFCDVLFGHDYAALMRKAADVALSGERKASRAG